MFSVIGPRPMDAAEPRWRALVPATMPGAHRVEDNRYVRQTVLIVDDHEGFRASVRALLETGGFDVVGEAADGMGAVEAVALLRPDIVLLDIQLPGLDGLAVAEQLTAGRDAPAVVLTSSRDAAVYGLRLRETSARGFIQKSALSGEALVALVG